ncbi:MAG: guanylate kinase [Anaerovoracaceae bacterium]|nr:guanylate kinase [Anaerovoracaceae bacterium]
MRKGQLFVISGPSGTGKGTICRELVKDSNVVFSISMTTRRPREFEVDGRDYHFVTSQRFQEAIDNQELLEHAVNFDNCYGTPKKFVIDAVEEGKDVLLDIDIKGALEVKRNYPNGIFIFILPPSMAELRKRITGRASEEPDIINVRLAGALKEVTYIDKYDYCVVNDQLEEAVNRVKAIMVAEHSRVSADIYQLIEEYKEEL